jgi:pseudouridine kinase
MKGKTIVVIGGLNIDICGFPFNKLIAKDSNPGKIKFSYGGVGHNIAQNLKNLKANVSFISIVGKDFFGNSALKNLKTCGLKAYVFTSANSPTSSYMSILEKNFDMACAVSSMSIYDELSVKLIKQKENIIKNADYIVCDTNLSQDLLNYITQTYRDKKICIDPVSTAKAMKVKNILPNIYIFKPNIYEACALSKITFKTKKDLPKIADFFIKKGVQKCFISLGQNGIFYADKNTKKLFIPKTQKIENATGAGDAFNSGLIFSYAYNNNNDIQKSIEFAHACAVMTLSCQDTLNPQLNQKNVKALMKKLGAIEETSIL